MSNKPQTRAAENADPHELNNPVPRVLLGVIGALVIWAIVYIFSASPDSAAALGDQREIAALSASSTDGSQAVDGKQIFTNTCQACHQPTGQGLPGVFPPLAGAEWVTGDAEILSKILLHGLTGSITVAGSTYNGAMPGFGNQFNDAELAAVLTFIRSEWGNNSPPIEASTIAAMRAATKDRHQPWAGEEELRQSGAVPSP